MHNGYPFNHEHSYQSVMPMSSGKTFTAKHCAACNEHKLVSLLRKLFRIK